MKSLNQLLKLGVTLFNTALLCACQTHRDSTLFLTKTGIVEKTITPSREIARYVDTTPSTTSPSTTSPLNKEKAAKIDVTKEQNVPAPKNYRQNSQRVIEIGTQPRVNYSRIEVYTEIPVPVQYSPARVISNNGQTTFIPATPTRIKNVRVGPNSRISGFIDYGPTINIPVGTKQGTRYIQQRSPMPMPIIDSVGITYE